MSGHTPGNGVDLDELARLAAKATPGGWGWRHFGNDPEAPCRIVSYEVDPWAVIADEIWQEPDAAFIAACSPSVVAVLVQRIKNAEQDLVMEQERTAFQAARVAELEAPHPHNVG